MGLSQKLTMVKFISKLIFSVNTNENLDSPFKNSENE